MSLRSPLGRARGHGSAKAGVHHWWVQRLTGVALVPLSLWVVFSLAGLADAGHAEVVGWISQPLVTALLLGFVIAAFYHLQLGLQVIIEDYVHTRPLQLIAQVAVRLGAVLFALIAIVSILKISLA
ncbi:MAG: succinate dehydrogenase, hydrophobic membrane anchor protein [Gammaproteobacteria bacterium]|nr:succinate dehydrogenase, hydrophobic membrane anchor protein [Gammaproteobacteria bacterium]